MRRGQVETVLANTVPAAEQQPSINRNSPIPLQKDNAQSHTASLVTVMSMPKVLKPAILQRFVFFFSFSKLEVSVTGRSESITDQKPI